MAPEVTVSNQLLDRLPAEAGRSLISACRPIELEFAQELAVVATPVERVLFPTTAVISVTVQVDGHPSLEMGMIGHEGMLGATLALGIQRHPMSAIVQGAGSALEISVSAFQDQLADNPPLVQVVHGYLFLLSGQLAQTAACHAFHEVSPRLARWLLMMDDRAHGKPLVLTHLFLADMLGVRRSAVTIAAGHLQQKRLIRYSRGHIQVLSRPGLEAVACECYAADLAAYRRQFGDA